MERGELVQRFERVFGSEGEVVTFFVPDQVNLMGEHTEYNGGKILGISLADGIYGAARLHGDGGIRLHIDRESSHPDLLSAWGEQMFRETREGAEQILKQEGVNIQSGIDLLITGRLPAGVDVVRSGALDLMLLLVIRRLLHPELTYERIKELIGRIREEVRGMSRGRGDLMVMMKGRKDEVFSYDLKTKSGISIPMSLSAYRLMIIDSRIEHAGSLYIYKRRREECGKILQTLKRMIRIEEICDLDERQYEIYKDFIQDPILMKRAEYIVYEAGRVIRGTNALRLNQWDRFGELMNESFRSLNTLYEISCPSLDFLAEIARKTDEIVASRMVGAGLKGAILTLVHEDAIEDVQKHFSDACLQKYNLTPEFYILGSGRGAYELS